MKSINEDIKSGTFKQAYLLYGEEAVEKGIIDAVGGLSDGLACLYRQIREQKGAEG